MSAFGGRDQSSWFSASSTAEQVTQGVDGTGLTAIVTGSTNGIGVETARVLALRGVHVVMAVRNTNAGRTVKEAILEQIPEANIDVMELDLSSIASVRKFASEYISLGLPLNILINNAGVCTFKSMLSKDNIELNFATNHLGHFLLTSLLLETMKNTVRESKKEGRIINVSSKSQSFAKGIHFDKHRGKNRLINYAESKLSNILHANELSRRFQEEGIQITANSVHPGQIVTNISGCTGSTKSFFIVALKLFVKNIQQGAATTCYVALNPQVKGVCGRYFVDCAIAKVNPLAKDENLAKKLWDYSLSLTNYK